MGLHCRLKTLRYMIMHIFHLTGSLGPGKLLGIQNVHSVQSCRDGMKPCSIQATSAAYPKCTFLLEPSLAIGSSGWHPKSCSRSASSCPLQRETPGTSSCVSCLDLGLPISLFHPEFHPLCRCLRTSRVLWVPTWGIELGPSLYPLPGVLPPA